MFASFRFVFAILALLSSITFATSPFFIEGFGGFNPDQFPVPQDNPPVQPAGYAFGIWGVIYIWLIVGMAWGVIRRHSEPHWHSMRKPLSLSLGLGTFWLAVAVKSPIWASVLIWAMLLSALVALFRSPIHDRRWANYPVGLYAGWLSAASCVSLGLVAAGYGYMDEKSAGLTFIALAAIIGTIVQLKSDCSPSYGIAVLWALIAVIVATWHEVRAVSLVATGGAALVLTVTIRAIMRVRRLD